MHMRIHHGRPRPAIHLIDLRDLVQVGRDTQIALMPIRGLLDGLLQHLVLILIDLLTADLTRLDQTAQRQRRTAHAARLHALQHGCGPIRVRRDPLILPVERQRAQRDHRHRPGAGQLPAGRPFRAFDLRLTQFLRQTAVMLAGERMHMTTLHHDRHRIGLRIGHPPGQRTLHHMLAGRPAAGVRKNLRDHPPVGFERIIRDLRVHQLVGRLRHQVRDTADQRTFADPTALIQPHADQREPLMHRPPRILAGQPHPVRLIQRGRRRELDGRGDGENMDRPIVAFQHLAVRQRNARRQIGQSRQYRQIRPGRRHPVLPVARVRHGRLAGHLVVQPRLAGRGSNQTATRMTGHRARRLHYLNHAARYARRPAGLAVQSKKAGNERDGARECPKMRAVRDEGTQAIKK